MSLLRLYLLRLPLRLLLFRRGFRFVGVAVVFVAVVAVIPFFEGLMDGDLVVDKEELFIQSIANLTSLWSIYTLRFESHYRSRQSRFGQQMPPQKCTL